MARIQAAVIGLVALILTPGVFFYFDVTPKLLVLLAGAAVLCLARPRAANRTFSIILLLSLASYVAATAVSDNPALSMFGSTWRRYGVVAHAAVLVVAWTISQATDRRTIVGGISFAGALSAVYGISQYFGYDPILTAGSYHIGEGIWTIVRPPGTLGYVSYFATWLLMCGFLGLSLRDRFGYAAAALCWTAMLFTGTRAALLGLAAGVLLWLYRSGFRAGRRTIAAGALAVVAAAVFYWSPAGTTLRSRTRWFVEDPWGGARPLLWRDSARLAARRPVFGHGPETFTAAFARAESLELARAYPDFAHESPHNIFVDALYSAGVPGLLCLLAVCRVGWRANDAWLAAAFGAGVVAQQFTAFTVPTALLIYAVAALSVGKASSTVSVPRFVLAPLALLFLFVAVRIGAADHSLARTQRALASADLQTADAEYRAYAARRLPGASAGLWYRRALLDVSQHSRDPLRRVQALQMAGVRAETAAQSAEEPFNAWYTLATVRAAQGDAGGTETALRRAIEAKPNWFKPHWTLARLLQLQGKREQAIAEAMAAVERDAGKHPEVSATLEGLRSGRN